jgi:hypothetical protein
MTIFLHPVRINGNFGLARLCCTSFYCLQKFNFCGFEPTFVFLIHLSVSSNETVTVKAL